MAGQKATRKIRLGERDYTFSFSINVMCEIEEAAKRSFFDVCNGFDSGSISTIRLFAKEMCAYPPLTLEQAGDLLDEHLDELKDAMVELIQVGTSGPNDESPEATETVTANPGTGNAPVDSPSGLSD